jgi:hypothetical protein
MAVSDGAIRMADDVAVVVVVDKLAAWARISYRTRAASCCWFLDPTSKEVEVVVIPLVCVSCSDSSLSNKRRGKGELWPIMPSGELSLAGLS